MKVRIGVSLGPAGGPDQFAAAVDLLEQAGVDSLWLPENVYSPLVEPFTGMAFALSRTRGHSDPNLHDFIRSQRFVDRRAGRAGSAVVSAGSSARPGR